MPDAQGTPGRLRILHVEDNRDNRLLVRRLLEPAGFVVEAEDGLAGVEAALRTAPALILLDMNLPGIDGYEVSTILRSFPTLEDVPLVAITAYALPGDRERTLVAGCDGYIEKPIDPDTFVARVRDFLGGRRERVVQPDEQRYLRELNQRLVYRLAGQVEELRRLNAHVVERAGLLEALHDAVADITAEVGVVPLLERLLPSLARALGAEALSVELDEPVGVCVVTPVGAAPARGDDVRTWPWSLPLTVRGRAVGVLRGRGLPAAPLQADEEPLLKIVANQLAIAVENARLYERVTRRAAEQESLVEAGRLLASTLQLSEVLHRLADLVRVRLAAGAVVRMWLRTGGSGEFTVHAQAGFTSTPPPERVRVSSEAGLLGRIVHGRAPLVVPDLRAAAGVANPAGVLQEGLVAFLGVPLVLDDNVVGVLTVATREPRHFTAEEVALVEALGRSAAVAVWNARLHEETEQRLRQTETLLAVSQAVGSTLDVGEVARRTTRELVRALGADLGGAWGLAADGSFVPLAGYHIPPGLFAAAAASRTAAEHHLVVAARAGGAIFAADSHRDPRLQHPLLELVEHRSVLVLPMRVKGEARGGFAVVWSRAPHALAPEELRLAEAMVQQAAIAIENARLLDAEREARGRLAASEQQYRDLFDNVMDIVYLHDVEGRILAINAAAVRTTGFSREELLGRNVFEGLVPEDRERARAFVQALVRGEPSREPFVGEFLAKDGRRLVLECRERVVSKEGAPVAILGSARDITERRQLERRQAAFMEIIKELAAEEDVDRLFPLIGTRVRELLAAASVVICLVDGEDVVFRSLAGPIATEGFDARRKIAGSRVRRVLAEKRVFATPDTRKDPLWRDSIITTRLGIRALLEVPIVLRGEAIGVLAVLHDEPRLFGEEEQRLLVSLAEHTAVALDRTRLLEKLEQRLAETEVLLSVSQAAGATLDITEIARRTVRAMVRALGADMGGAWRLDAAGHEFQPIAGYHVPSHLLAAFADRPLGAGEKIVHAVRQLRDVIVSEDSQADPRFDDPLARLVPHRSVLVAPMSVQSSVIGGFAVVWTRDRHRFTPEELRLVEGIAGQAAIAIENARLLEAERDARHHLAVSETRYRELFDNVIDIVYLHDLDGRLLAINEAGVRASGYTREQLLGMNVADLLTPLDADSALEAARRLARGEHVETFTAELARQDGGRVVLECVGRLISRDGVPVAVLGSGRDVTERRRLEERQAALIALGRDFATEMRLDALLPRIAEEARRMMRTDAASVLILQDRRLVLGGVAGLDVTQALPTLDVETSLAGRVLRTGAPAVHADLAADAEFGGSHLVRVLGYRALLMVPVALKDQPLGVLRVHHRTPRVFDAGDVEFLRALAAHAALAIENARLFQQTQSRLRETETLLTVSQELIATLDPTETMRRVAREISHATGAEMVGAYLAAPDGRELRPIAGYHVPPELIEHFMQFPIPIAGHPALEDAWKGRHSVWSTDAETDARINRLIYERFPVRSALVVPIIGRDGPIGAFFVIWWTTRHRFAPEEIRLVEGISDQAAMFLENARLYSEATRRRREAEELARLARMLTESLEAADVGERIVATALGLLGSVSATLRVRQPDDSLRLVATSGAPIYREELLAPGVGVMGRAVARGAAEWSPDLLDDPRVVLPEGFRRETLAAQRRAVLAVPLRVKGQITGVLAVANEGPRTFADAEITLLQTFADQAAIALENSRLYGELRAALKTVEESQQRIVQGERLRALGEMAGGVAHDFNNTLAIIVGRAEVLISATEDVELQRQLDVIIKVAMDAAQTVRRIQEFTRMRRSRPFQPVDLGQLVHEVVDVTRSRWKDEAEARDIKYDVIVDTPPTPAVAGDPSELREALTNIIFNALDAMPEGGRITLATGVDAGGVFCAVSDTGVGMSEDVKRRIFDPFFTTKGERGTGLGLSVVYGIVTRHGGELDVTSEPGRGSTFTIRVPLADDLGPGPAAAAAPAAAPPLHALVVDDESDVADVLADLLARDGHTVVVCTDGEEALARVRQESFDLVITDLGMPKLSGWEVARTVKQRRPGTPVAMITGWGDRIDPGEALLRGVEFIVSKPFKRDDLREMVAAAAMRREAGSRTPAGRAVRRGSAR
jgi:PAS domain S-box-containing protein